MWRGVAARSSWHVAYGIESLALAVTPRRTSIRHVGDAFPTSYRPRATGCSPQATCWARRVSRTSRAAPLSPWQDNRGTHTSFPVAACGTWHPVERAAELRYVSPDAASCVRRRRAAFANRKRRRTPTSEAVCPTSATGRQAHGATPGSSWRSLRRAGDRRFDSPSRLRNWTAQRYALAGFVWDRGRMMRSISP